MVGFFKNQKNTRLGILGFDNFMKKCSVRSFLPKFPKNSRFDFSRFCDFSKKYSVRFGRFCIFFEKMVGFLWFFDGRFYRFFRKILGFEYSVFKPSIFKNGRFFENRVKNREPSKKNLCIRIEKIAQNYFFC